MTPRLLLLPLLIAAAPAPAEPLPLGTLEASYLDGQVRADGRARDSEGYRAALSLPVLRQTQLLLEHSQRRIALGGDFEPDITFASAGVSFNRSMTQSPNVTALVAFTYERADFDSMSVTGGLGQPTVTSYDTETAEGYGVQISVRGRPAGAVELEASYRYANYGRDREIGGDEIYDTHRGRVGLAAPLPGVLRALALTAHYQLFNDPSIEYREALVGLRLKFD